MRGNWLLVVALCTCVGGGEALLDFLKGSNWNPFRLPNRLPIKEGHLSIGALGLPSIGHVVAVGHFSSSRRFDCVIVDSDERIATIWVMPLSEYKFAPSKAIVTVPEGHRIVNAILGDYDHDGFADLMVVHRPVSGSVSSAPDTMAFYFGDDVELRERAAWPSRPIARGTTPMPIDYRGIFQLDYLVVPPSGEGLQVIATKAHHPDMASTGLADASQALALPPSHPHPSVPNWSGQADFDGDGHPDLFLTLSPAPLSPPTALLIRRRLPAVDRSPDQMTLHYYDSQDYIYALPPGAGPLTITDIDGDGNLDVIFAVCHPANTCSEENSLHIMYNLQRPFCGDPKKSHASCKDASDLFPSKEGFAFEETPGNPGHLMLRMQDLFPQSKKTMRILFNDPQSGDPVPLSVGDFDLDSYPDVAMVITDAADPRNLANSKAAVLVNVPCTGSTCSEEDVKAYRRIFQPLTSTSTHSSTKNKGSLTALQSITHVVSVAFADFFGLGPLGLLLNTFTPRGGGPPNQRQLISITNGIFTDNFFLRTEVLSAVCPAPCGGGGKKKVGSKARAPLAVNYPGASFRIAFMDSDGGTQVRIGAQLAQVGNRALQYPSLLFGLDRTSNFVQKVHVGTNLLTSNAAATSSSIWSPSTRSHHSHANIFPNSDVIFWPPHATKSGWSAELQINPGEHVIYVFFSVAITLLVLGLLTAVFKVREMREDEQERRKNAVNFDAF